MVRSLLFLLAGCLLVDSALGAPTPMTSSSGLLSLKRGLMRSPFGFQIHSENTNWVQVPPPQTIKNLVAWYKAPEEAAIDQAGLTVRADKFDKVVSPTKYMRHWRADYSRFGFNILRIQPLQQDGEKGYLVELTHQSTQKQIRQVIFFKKDIVVTMSCRDNLQSFERTVKSCNQLFKNFSWL